MIVDYASRTPAALPSSAAAAPNAASTTGSSGDNAFSTLFIQLLASQLKSQSPLDPVDPTQFVGQLVQLNSLNELTQIRQLLSAQTAPPKTTAQSNSTTANSILSATQGA